MSDKKKLVIIGNGMVGARLIEEVIARGGSKLYDISIFGDEPYGNYNRILLSSVLAGTHDANDIMMNPIDWYAKQGVTLHTGSRVVRIDRAEKKVYDADGNSKSYDQLVFATGSRPFVPQMAGLYTVAGKLKDGIFVFRNLDDCEGMVKFGATAKRVAVIGGGLLGLEAARGLQSRGLDVTVLHLVSNLMDIQLDVTASGILKKTIERMGIHIKLDKYTTGIIGEEKIEKITFDDGSSLDCEMVVIAAGVRANSEIASKAGLDVQKGIVVKGDLSTSDPDIYAIGDCTQFNGQVLGLVAPGWQQAQVLADQLTGKIHSLYRGAAVATKLKVVGVELAVMGEKDSQNEDEVVAYFEPSRGVYKKLIVRDGKLAGAILVGDGTAYPRIQLAFDRVESLPEDKSSLLFPQSAEANAAGVEDLPDSAQICNCNGVSKGKIVSAVKGGARSFKALCDATRAGTGCGSCKLQVQAILESASDGLTVEDHSANYYVPGVPFAKPELIMVIKEKNLKSVSAVFKALANGKEDAGSKVGLASLLKTIWGKEYEDERDARYINDRVHANIQKDATFSVVPRVYGGVTSAEQLRKIADVADRYKVPMVKITGGQRIDLLGISKDDLPAVWKDLDMPSGHAYTKAFRTCKTCVGTDFCRYGVGDSTALGIAIEKRFQGVESPHKMKLAASGCPRNCAESTTKDLGAVAIEGGKWEVYIGGAAGSRVRKGDILCVVSSHEEVLKYMGRFMQYYRENGRYLERTYDFVERMGIDKLRKILIENAEGICQRLDEEIQSIVDAYKDPWQEAYNPVNETQFQSVIK